ncbi:MAG TPA: ABC transporter ATP-binding protein [Ensifer sp.]|nr:ABC transporter ATP-binding protein [Ensifer sp.]
MTEVSIERLTMDYGVHLAVDGISLRIRNGEFISLLGPSGCGKTTTLKMIAGFEQATSGAIRFDGSDVMQVPAEKRDIGMVFQNYALFPHMTVAGNLAFGLEMRKLPKAEIQSRIAKVLEMVQLSSHAERYPIQLSGGQQQRVALARALVIEPKILLLDEPLANLDAKLREEMRVFIREIQRRVGITTVYVTHDQAEAMTMSDRVVVMFGGKIAQMGTPAEIYDQPASVEVAKFVGQVNLMRMTVDAVSADGSMDLSGPFGPIRVKAIAGAAPGRSVTVAVRPEAIDLVALGEGRPATIVSSYYSGSLMDYRVRLADGTLIDVQTFPRQRFADGDAVGLSVSADRWWPLEINA